jgi:hypothetical protein
MQPTLDVRLQSPAVRTQNPDLEGPIRPSVILHHYGFLDVLAPSCFQELAKYLWIIESISTLETGFSKQYSATRF